jgi:hypothetical protein
VKEEPLSAFKIADGAKIMLVASENPHTVINPAPPPRLQPLEVLPEYACRIDDSIVALGAPTGAIAGWKGTNTATLPEAPLIVRTINGVAEFSLETDALFLKYPGGFNDRIFLSDLTAVGSVPIQDGTYSVIAMQTKLEKIFWIAFVPAQYTEAILTTLDPYTGLKRQLLFAL